MASIQAPELTTFPEGFLWGSATSSYQIEGAWNAGGKSESIWDRFSATPGKIEDGTNGRVACNHYELWPADISLMSSLGLQTYRFSLSWPRILPEGRGHINKPGLDFYSRLVDALLEAGIVPSVTLYHWDLPQILQDLGGWPDRMIVAAFAEYADAVTRHLGDRVSMWSTINEPWVVAKVGYQWGVHAPGHTSQREAVRAAHHLLLAHGTAVPIIRANSPRADVGIVLNLAPQHAASTGSDDRRAARFVDGLNNRWFLDPLVGFGYPADISAFYGNDIDVVQPGDMQIIATPIDFLGVNYYSRGVNRADEQSVPRNVPQTVFPSDETTAMDWEVYPAGLTETLVRLHTHYQFPALYVTENGAAYDDEVSADGRVHDERRVSYYRRHVQAAAQAMALGVPLRGYYVWSLMDNFEWAHGLSKRFGLVYVDFETQERILKDSAIWYRDFIAANSIA